MIRTDASCAAVSPCAPLALCWTEPQEPSHGDYAFFRLARRWGLLRGTLRAPWPQRAVSPSPGTPIRALPHPARSQAGGRACAQARRALGSDHWRSARRRGGTEAIAPAHDSPAHLTRAGCPWGKCSRGLFRAAARRRRPIVVVGSSHVSPSSIDPPPVMTVASRGFTSARCRGERPSRPRGLLGAPSIIVSPSVASHPTLRHCPRCAL